MLAGALALGRPAFARSDKAFTYPREAAWPAAVRFLVVDEHLRILDKDEGAGYALFELKDGGKTYRGALELVVASGDARGVRIVITIEDRPSWMELAMLARLEAKLRAELGPQSSTPRPPSAGTPPASKPTDGKAAPTAPAPPPPTDGAPPMSPTP